MGWALEPLGFGVLGVQGGPVRAEVLLATRSAAQVDVMHAYACHGLRLDSELELPGLPAAARGPATAHVRLTTPSEATERAAPPGDHFEFGEHEVCTSIAGLATYRIRSGCEVLIVPRLEHDPERLRAGLLGPALSLLLLQRGLLPLHASTVLIGDRAVALCAESGGGKSTLAAALVRRGHRFLADDLTAVDPRRRPILAHAGAPHIKLAADLLRHLGLEASDYPRADCSTDEHLFDIRALFQAAPVSLHSIVVLRAAEEEEIVPLPGIAGFVEILRELKWPLLQQAAIGARELMQRCSAVSASVPVTLLLRPRRLDRLEQLAARVEELVTSTG